jgi:phthiocerol/phenolphthiocerol synthesis type-I polyketide synthase E
MINNGHPLPVVSQNDIAIVGMAGRFPGAATLEQFWENIRCGMVSVTHFDEAELRAAGVSEADLASPDYVRAASRIENAEDFDADFFSYSPIEANFIDPQHRIFLESSVEALEDAGCDPRRFPGHIGVFAGCALNVRHLSRALSHFDETLGEPQLFTILANDKDYLATRLSYKLNMTGPSINLQAACSTSLVAVHLACQSLLNGECDAAIAGGASVVFSYAKMGYRFSEGSVFSSDGVCRPFDADASGTVFGDGVGVVVLKRLADALASGDNIRAVIKGSALNNDGARKASFAAPSIAGQASVIAEAIAMAGVPAESIGYIEAHGTGTSIGDPIEIEGLKRVFKLTSREGRCAIGSVKGNIGHLNAAAGIAGLIKTVLALEYDEIPPTANFETLNPKIDFTGTAFFINDRLVPWGDVSPHRRAGVSSFGIGGTNAHVVVEAAPSISRSGIDETCNRALLLSARTRPALEQLAISIGDFLDRTPDVNLAELAHTLSEGRTRHSQGLAVVGADRTELSAALRTRSAKDTIFGRVIADAPGMAMVFPGQGSQSLQMGQGIYPQEPVFREAFDRCLRILRNTHNHDIGELFKPGIEADAQKAELLNRTDYAQPAVFATSYSIAQLWLSWGGEPTGLIGHSLGELVAACIAGVFNLEDALGLVALRGRLMNAAEPGAMVAVLAQPEVLELELGSELCIASYNGPAACVVAGPIAPIEALQLRLTAQGIPHTRLRTSHAFHTPAMASAVAPFVEAVRSIERNAPRLPFISNVTGCWITDDQATSPEYWGDHILQPVRFSQGAATLANSFVGAMLEVGPGRQLSGLLAPILDDTERPVFASIPAPGHLDSEHADLLRAAAGLSLTGIELDWSAINRTGQARKMVAPKYPFQRRTYCLGASNSHTTERTVTAPSGSPAGAHTVKLYEPGWKRIHLSQNRDHLARSWLIFDDQQQFGTQLGDELRKRGDQVIAVARATEFHKDGPTNFRLSPGNRQHVEALAAALSDAGRLPDAIAYCWPLDPNDAADAAVEAAHFDITGLVTQIKAIDFGRQLDVLLFAANGQDVFGAGGTEPAGTALVGLARSLPEEVEALKICYLDLERADLAAQRIDTTIASILPVLAGADSRILALRNGRFFVPILDVISAHNRDMPTLNRLVQSGAWLITGGLGGVGLAIARELVHRGVRQLALVSRRAMPPRSEWAARLDAGDSEAELLRSITALEASGAEVEVLVADVVDQAALAGAFAQARAAFGQITAVVHCAGLVDGGQAATKSEATAQSVMRPKVVGTRNIEAITAHAQLELLVLCSSVTTLLNNPGQTDYASANAFMDGFATSSSISAKRIVTINWDTWSEVGMAVDYSVHEAFLDARDAWLEKGLKTDEGVQAFFDALASDASRIVVSKLCVDDEGQLEQPIAQKRVTADSGVLHPRPDLGVPYVAPRSELETTAARIMADMLSLQTVGIEDNFLDLGCHSLTATRFAARMRQETGVVIPLSSMFEGLTLRSTIDALSLEEWEEGAI